MRIEDITPAWAKQTASDVLDALLATTASDFRSGETSWETLQRFPWSRFCAVDQQPSQHDLIALNEVFDLRSCFGRAIACFELISRYHPSVTDVSWREVREDWFRMNMLDQWAQRYQQSDPESSWFSEFLMYEEPHAVFSAGDYQFDPASMLLPEKMRRHVSHGLHHTKHQPWSAVVACVLVNRALAEQDHMAALEILDEAARVSPGMAIVWQTRVRSLAYLGRFDEAQQVIMSLHGEGFRSARMFFALEAVGKTGNLLAESFYGERLWKFLDARLEMEVFHV
jgi:hypothetical protein